MSATNPSRLFAVFGAISNLRLLDFLFWLFNFFPFFGTLKIVWEARMRLQRAKQNSETWNSFFLLFFNLQLSGFSEDRFEI